MEERYELNKNTIIKDLDTYTSIVNNNINRNTRLLTLVSLGAVALNFMFGSLLAVNPVIGVAGGVLIGGLTAGAAVFYRVKDSRHLTRIQDSHIVPDVLEEKSADKPQILENRQDASVSIEENKNTSGHT